MLMTQEICCLHLIVRRTNVNCVTNDMREQRELLHSKKKVKKIIVQSDCVRVCRIYDVMFLPQVRSYAFLYLASHTARATMN